MILTLINCNHQQIKIIRGIAKIREYFVLDKKGAAKKLAKHIDLSFGALAQLGERMTGSHEVSGSIPLCSTNKSSGLPILGEAAFF